MKNKTLLKLIPLLYNADYSFFFTIYGIDIRLINLRCNVIHEHKLKEIFINESPHFHCALEFFDNIDKIQSLKRLSINSMTDYLDSNNLVNSKRYIEYIQNAHPNTNAVDTFKVYLKLFEEFLKAGPNRGGKCTVLVAKKTDLNGKNFWLLIDGLHRSSIFMALNEQSIGARVKFP